VTDISANAVTGRIRISWDPARTPLSRPLRRLQSLGYRPFLAAGVQQERERRRERNGAGCCGWASPRWAACRR
jgi:Cu2+-exporting ATPase